MKKSMFSSKVLLIAGALTLGLTACNKSNITDDADIEMAAAQNLNIAEVEDDNVQIIADQAEATGSASGLRVSPSTATEDILGDCAVVTRDSLSTPRKITIDYGTGCTGPNGIVRKGKIIITHTGPYRAIGTVIHMVSENYYVNDNKVDIDRTVTNRGMNNNGHPVFTIEANRTVTFPDGTTSSSMVSKVRTWVAGFQTPRDFSDDLFKVTGSGTHTSRRGITYDATTLTALTRNVACHQFTAGILKIVRQGQRDRHATLDFGNGECDDEATVTLPNGRTFTINLRH